jgi:hypothetical protein
MTAQCLTRGRHPPPQSLHFITVGRRRALTEEQTQRRHSTRRKNAASSPTFNGCPTTRTRRRYLTTCIFSLSDYNRLGPRSRGSRTDPTVLWSLSGSENELTPQQCELMTIHRDSCTIYPTTDALTTEQRTTPTECRRAIARRSLSRTVSGVAHCVMRARSWEVSAYESCSLAPETR